jgi:hypothetical protein
MTELFFFWCIITDFLKLPYLNNFRGCGKVVTFTLRRETSQSNSMHYTVFLSAGMQ